MGLLAVLGWTIFGGGHLPRWVWGAIVFDVLFGLPRALEQWHSLFATGHF